MKIKNIKLSLLVLGTLVALSFALSTWAQEKSQTSQNIFLDSDQDGLSDEEEKMYGTDPYNADTDGDGYTDGAEVRAGYDPLKPAPGDKIIPAETKNPATPEVLSASTENKNLTHEVAKKIYNIASDPNQDNQQISIDQIKSLVDESLNGTSTPDTLPEVSKDEIKIKKQNYKNLSADEIKAKKKEDFANYVAAIYYIFSSNSPKPITSTNDIVSSITSLSTQAAMAFSTGDATSLKELASSGDKILEQMKDVEVPEELVDIHLKGLQFAKYAATLKDKLDSNPDDPLSSIANFGKIEGFLETLMTFSGEIESKLTEYGLQYDSTVKNILTDLGVPDLGTTVSDTQSTTTATEDTTSNTNDTTTAQ